MFDLSNLSSQSELNIAKHPANTSVEHSLGVVMGGGGGGGIAFKKISYC